jgi:hypothetical protein
MGSGGGSLPTYPTPGSDFDAFYEHLGDFAERIPGWLPNVVAVFTSSRSYGGYAENPGRGEPLSYEEGHALNAWLEENEEVEGVWHGWGPYLWAPSCESGEVNGSGICYEREDFVADGVHPSASGQQKIALLIHDRFLDEPWYAR